MIVDWILIMSLTIPYGAAISTQQFTTESYCNLAGQAYVKMHESYLHEAHYICVRK